MGFMTTEWGRREWPSKVIFHSRCDGKVNDSDAKGHTASWTKCRTSGDLVGRAARLQAVTSQEMPRGSKAG